MIKAKVIIDAQIEQLKEKLKICEFLEEMQTWIAEPNPIITEDEDGVECVEDDKKSAIILALNQLVMTAGAFLLQGDSFEAEKYTRSYFKPPTYKAYKAKSSAEFWDELEKAKILK